MNFSAWACKTCAISLSFFFVFFKVEKNLCQFLSGVDLKISNSTNVNDQIFVNFVCAREILR